MIDFLFGCHCLKIYEWCPRGDGEMVAQEFGMDIWFGYEYQLERFGEIRWMRQDFDWVERFVRGWTLKDEVEWFVCFEWIWMVGDDQVAD